MNQELKDLISQPVLLAIWENKKTKNHITLTRMEDYYGYKIFYLDEIENITAELKCLKTRQAAMDIMRKNKEWIKIWSRR